MAEQDKREGSLPEPDGLSEEQRQLMKQSTIMGVYAGPTMMAAYAGPMLNGGTAVPACAGPQPDDAASAQSVMMDQGGVRPDLEADARMEMAYAGPMPPASEMMMVYAGPQQMPIMMMAYAGPKQPSGGMIGMMDQMRQQMKKPSEEEGAYRFCPECGTQSFSGNYCCECGAPLRDQPFYRKCKSCGAQLPCTQKFCHECGTPVKEEERSWKCPTCGSEVAPKQKFCPECGAKVTVQV